MTVFLLIITVHYKTLTFGLTKRLSGVFAHFIKEAKTGLFRPLTAKTGVRFPVGSPKNEAYLLGVFRFFIAFTSGNRTL